MNFTQAQKMGLVGLIVVIILLQLALYFLDFSKPEEVKFSIQTPEIVQFQKEIDSLKQVKIEENKPKIYPFNPSFLTDYRAYWWGMTPQEYDRLLTHRKSGQYINSAKEFQQVTGVGDSVFNAMKPHFKFPDWITNQKQNSFDRSKKNKAELLQDNSKPLVKKDLNQATYEDLITIYGIGDKLAKRILKYKEVLQAYSFNDQLYEVWYLDKEVADRLLERFTVIEKPDIQRININEAYFKQILHLPYIDYDLTKKIFNYRDEVAEIQSLEELKQIEGFPVEKFDRISLYLKAE